MSGETWGAVHGTMDQLKQGKKAKQDSDFGRNKGWMAGPSSTG